MTVAHIFTPAEPRNKYLISHIHNFDGTKVCSNSCFAIFKRRILGGIKLVEDWKWRILRDRKI